MNVLSLGDLCRPRQWPIVSASQMTEHGYPVFGANGQIGRFDSYTHESETIAVGCRGSCGEVHLVPGKSHINGNAMALDDLNERLIDRRYLFRWLKFRGFRDVTTGTSQPQITQSNIRRVDVPALPLAEQKNVAAILDKADAIQITHHRIFLQFDALLNALFVEFFGDPAVKSNIWKTVKLGEVSDVVGGLALSAARASHPIELPYLRVANVFRDRLDLSDVKTVRLTAAERNRATLKSGDVLIVEGHGNPAEVGRSAIWNGSIDPVSHQNHLIRVRVDDGTARAAYVNAWINSAGGRAQLVRAGKTTSGLNTINISQVRDLRIPLPDLASQSKFECVREKARAAQLRAGDALAEAESLYASLAQRAFRGEL